MLLDETAKSFLEALERGLVCLHPTDTLPGLSFNPASKEARKRLYTLKGRDFGKTLISLVSSLDKAKSFWKPLPQGWEKILGQLWPSKLTVVWKASSLVPGNLVGEDGSIALRCPQFSASSDWMMRVLGSVSYPLPSTSVNFSGEKSKKTWEEASLFCEEKGIFIPNLEKIQKFSEKASTIIRLEEKSFKVLREGAVTEETIKRALESELRK